MKSMNSIRTKILALYIFLLLLFVIVIIFFSNLYNKRFVEMRLETIVSRIEEGDDLTEVLLDLQNDGYEIYFYVRDHKVTPSFINDLDGEKIRITNFSIIHNDQNNKSYVLINDVFIVEVNEELLEEYMANLYLILISAVVLYLLVSLIILQYSLFQIINPLLKINNELQRISEFDFEGKPLNIKTNDEIRYLAQSVENIKLSLRSYNRNRSALVSALVHELKSPVSTISTVLQLNKMGHEKYDDATTRTIVEENINTISMITKMSLEVFEKQSIYKVVDTDVSKLVASNIEQVKPLLDEKHLLINVESDNSNWKVDVESFDLIISNLLTNICNYSKDDTTADIVISKDVITFTNVISDSFTSGTGKGLKIISSLLNDMGMKLEYYEKEGIYYVIITKDN